MKVTVNITRLGGSLSSRLEEARRRITRKVVKGIDEVTEKILVESRRLVPRDTYTMWHSGVQHPAVWHGNTISGSVGYAGPNSARRAYSPVEKREVNRDPQKYFQYIHGRRAGIAPAMTTRRGPGTGRFMGVSRTGTPAGFLFDVLENRAALRRAFWTGVFS